MAVVWHWVVVTVSLAALASMAVAVFLTRKGRLPAPVAAVGCGALCVAMALLNLTGFGWAAAVPWALTSVLWWIHVGMLIRRSGM